MKLKKSLGETRDVPSGRAISIRQPYVEEILTGKKKYEFRSRATHIRGRVYLYASGKFAEGYEDNSLPRGTIVGSVEIVGCKFFPSRRVFGYELKHPKRYTATRVPDNQAQPCFFFPFGPSRKPRKDPSLVKKKAPLKGKLYPKPILANFLGEIPRTLSGFEREFENYLKKKRLIVTSNPTVSRADKALKRLLSKDRFSILEIPTLVRKNVSRKPQK
ncbi:MAG: ASCH domain-containing protein [Bdellovibrionaceae bacterium]|nr:ASCH domain-containing protein [Pseudobdellovibrionaceae bacterium]